MKFLFLILLPVLAFAQNIPSDQVKIGRPQTSADKELIFDTNDGVSNKKLSVEKSSKLLKFDGNSFQLGDGASTDKSLIINGTSGKALKYDAADTQFEFNDDVGIDGASLKTNSINSFSGTETAIEQNARVKGKLNIGTGTNEIRVQSGNLEFSNDGVIYKKVGSGSGGGEGGLNLIRNGSFEDGAGNWTATGGTYTVQPYANPSENEISYARFVASGSGQKICSDAIVVPDFLVGGCLAYSEYKTTDSNAFELQVLSASSVINRKALVTTNGLWLQTEPVPVLCPAAGQNIQVCFESLAAGTIEVDKVYKGSENRVVQQDCKGIAECETTFVARIDGTASPSVVSMENLDWINGNCTRNATGDFTCNFNSGVFLDAPNCSCIAEGANSPTCNINSATPPTSSQIRLATVSGGGAVTNPVFYLTCTRSTDYAQAKPQNAVTNRQSAWFIDANIGGANPSLGGAAVASYTEITDAGLDMVLNSGSAPAKIPCSATNASTGLTCSAGSEGVGAVFTPPYPGYFEVCAQFSHFMDVAGSGSIDISFQLIQTANSAQTILQEGKARTGGFTANGNIGTPVVNCGTFLFSDTAEKTIRLMYEQTASVVAANTIRADRSASVGQRDIRVTVRPSTQNVPRPVLTGDQVVAPGWGSGAKECTVWFGGAGSMASPTQCGANPCTVYQSTCPTTGVERVGTGQHQVTWPAGTWKNSSAIKCDCDFSTTSGSNLRSCGRYGLSSLLTDSSGGYVGNFVGKASDSGDADSYGSITCTSVTR